MKERNYLIHLNLPITKRMQQSARSKTNCFSEIHEKSEDVHVKEFTIFSCSEDIQTIPDCSKFDKAKKQKQMALK